MVALETRLATLSGSKTLDTRSPVRVEFKKLPFSASKQCSNASFKKTFRRGELPSTPGALDRMARKLDESPPLGGTSSHKSDKGTLTNDVAAKSGNVIKLTHRTPVTNAAQCRQWPTPPGCKIGEFITMSAPLQEPSIVPEPRLQCSIRILDSQSRSKSCTMNAHCYLQIGWTIEVLEKENQHGLPRLQYTSEDRVH